MIDKEKKEFMMAYLHCAGKTRHPNSKDDGKQQDCHRVRLAITMVTGPVWILQQDKS
jgi:hypothetical protein